MPQGNVRERIRSLDGLRALACLAVVAYHCQVPHLGGGWLGVDVFFVLSGYLITGLLMSEGHRSGRLRLGRFYLRRAARLYPALVFAVAWVVLLDHTLNPKLIARPDLIMALSYTTDLRMANGGASASDLLAVLPSTTATGLALVLAGGGYGVDLRGCG